MAVLMAVFVKARQRKMVAKVLLFLLKMSN
jgi:hypothetical protein